MKITKYLNIIQDQKTLEILRFFVRNKGNHSGRHIASILGMNHRTCRKYLDDLTKRGILFKTYLASSHLYNLESNYFTTDVLIPMIEQEQQLYRKIQTSLIRRFSSYCQAIVIYGSYARQEETDDSDLDVCFLLNCEATPELDEKLTQFQNDIKQKYGLFVEPYVISQSEIAAKKDLDVLKEIQKEGSWIYGTRSEVKELW